MPKKEKITYFFVDILQKVFILLSCMDTKKDAKIPQCGDLTAGAFVVGAKQLRKALNAGRATAVWLAKNADPAVTEPLIALCESCGIAYDLRYTMQELGAICGIEVGAAAAASVKTN